MVNIRLHHIAKCSRINNIIHSINDVIVFKIIDIHIIILTFYFIWMTQWCILYNIIYTLHTIIVTIIIIEYNIYLNNYCEDHLIQLKKKLSMKNIYHFI